MTLRSCGFKSHLGYFGFCLIKCLWISFLKALVCSSLFSLNIESKSQSVLCELVDRHLGYFTCQQVTHLWLLDVENLSQLLRSDFAATYLTLNRDFHICLEKKNASLFGWKPKIFKNVTGANCRFYFGPDYLLHARPRNRFYCYGQFAQAGIPHEKLTVNQC